MDSACFDCNICLELVQEPVVTLCGHLFCWSCIYEWFRFQTTSNSSSYDHPQCPVCKSPISHSTIVPLYGRGELGSGSRSIPKRDIPPRPQVGGPVIAGITGPPTHRERVLYQYSHLDPYQSSDLHEEDSQSAVFGDRVNRGTGGIQYGMLGDIVYARVFGNSDSLYPNTYGLGSRLRWEEMQADMCLNRIFVFLLCCFLLCLVLF